ncbi:GTPase ObgE [Holzapfeliella floricola]|uniref:GTPase ObgE n=1 Tax=Holzapfeliella floricola TaxID=679249 RepID=UPI0007056340|nr:GTPase ObgE [Holzapfeliella floricola]
MFVDHTRVEVQAGKGGDGAISFRREKYVPMGGPAGGDGGRGGSIIFKVDPGLRTLMDFKFRRKFKAKSGENGMNKSMYGRQAEDSIIAVPAGTIVYDDETNEVIGDLTHDGEELVVAKGGRGGRGNIHFKSAKNSAPEVAENGEPGQFRKLKLELKVIADVGLVGFPSVGKSTLLSVATSARPKIAAYHFTTLVPNLGMVQLDSGQDFAMADLPGLIEGASLGVGLGIQFLRHVERTKVILHLIDMDPNNGRDPYEDYKTIRKELKTYDDKLMQTPEILVATKMDVPGAAERLAEFKSELGENVPEIFEISSVTHKGVKEVLQKTADVLETLPKEIKSVEAEASDVKHHNYDYKAEDDKQEFYVEKENESMYVVKGEKVERLLQMSNLTHNDGIMRFARQLRSFGIDDALREAGAKNGDDVFIGDFSFEFVE